MSKKLRVLYLQYTNPAAYPPLQHSSRILANEGWEILFLGSGSHGADVLELPPHPNICVKRVGFCLAGWRQKLHYVWFGLWVFLWTLRWRPRWIYASDLLSSPVAVLLSFVPGLFILYHEHDSPITFESSDSRFQKFLLKMRRTLALRAYLCVLPNERRAERFTRETGTKRPVLCVWNCPSLREAAKNKRAGTRDRLVVFFHGSIVPARLPLTIMDALTRLPNRVMLRVAGYETIGHAGYLEALQNHAIELGLSDRFEFLGCLSRQSLLEHCRDADVGLAFVPLRPEDFNQQAMTGASNKPFDYLACGLALLVSDLPDWRRMFVESGYGLACNPGDAGSIASALDWFLRHPAETRAMRVRGRQQILSEWNYERQFVKVLAHMSDLGQLREA